MSSEKTSSHWSKREKEILELRKKHWTCKEIANEMDISVQRVSKIIVTHRNKEQVRQSKFLECLNDAAHIMHWDNNSTGRAIAALYNNDILEEIDETGTTKYTDRELLELPRFGMKTIIILRLALDILHSDLDKKYKIFERAILKAEASLHMYPSSGDLYLQLKKNGILSHLYYENNLDEVSHKEFFSIKDFTPKDLAIALRANEYYKAVYISKEIAN